MRRSVPSCFGFFFATTRSNYHLEELRITYRRSGDKEMRRALLAESWLQTRIITFYYQERRQRPIAFNQMPHGKEGGEKVLIFRRFFLDNPAGGVTQNFSKRVLLKDEFRTIFTDPRYDIPLYKLVYNDSVITSYHWDWSTFKIQGATGERMVREVLYNVPPLYHLDAAEWEKYRQDITNHQAVWSEFARNAVGQEMTGFEYLQEDGSVQKTQYGESLAAVANFGSTAYRYGQIEIPACSALIQADGQEAVYTPSVGEKNR